MSLVATAATAATISCSCFLLWTLELLCTSLDSGAATGLGYSHDALVLLAVSQYLNPSSHQLSAVPHMQFCMHRALQRERPFRALCCARSLSSLKYTRVTCCCLPAAVGSSRYLRNLGYEAIPSMNDTALAIPYAIKAGLGEYGRHGLLITPEFGPRLRLGKIFTNMPLAHDTPIKFGVKEFCGACGIHDPRSLLQPLRLCTAFIANVAGCVAGCGLTFTRVCDGNPPEWMQIYA